VVNFEPQTIAKKKEKNQPTFKNKNLITISSYLILQLTVDDSDDYLNNALNRTTLSSMAYYYYYPLENSIS